MGHCEADVTPGEWSKDHLGAENGHQSGWQNSKRSAEPLRSCRRSRKARGYKWWTTDRRSIRFDASVDPTTPTRATISLAASVDPTDARNSQYNAVEKGF
jgi:hypothetical protein